MPNQREAESDALSSGENMRLFSTVLCLNSFPGPICNVDNVQCSASASRQGGLCLFCARARPRRRLLAHFDEWRRQSTHFVVSSLTSHADRIAFLGPPSAKTTSHHQPQMVRTHQNSNRYEEVSSRSAPLHRLSRPGVGAQQQGKTTLTTCIVLPQQHHNSKKHKSLDDRKC